MREGMVCQQNWPEYDESKTVASAVQLAVQIGGKMRGNIQVPTDSEQDAVVNAVLADAKLSKYTENMDIVKVILVKNQPGQPDSEAQSLSFAINLCSNSGKVKVALDRTAFTA